MTQFPASSSGSSSSSTSWARAPAYRSASARGETTRSGSWTSDRMRSETSTPPGSRSRRTGIRRASSSSASPRACVVLPAPSSPSIVISRPRATPATISTMAAMASLAGTEHHPHARAVLGAALPPAGRPSHAYLFHGPAGSGKRTAARAFAAELLAEGAPDPDAVRDRVGRGAHPDLTWVVPSGAHELLVADVDQAVVGAASRTPFEAARRVFVIERADTMIEPAANRMLKTLEEPPPFVHVILLTERPTEVMETIASRCQHVRFDPLPADEVAERLVREEGVEPVPARAAARLALGDAARARALATGE